MAFAVGNEGRGYALQSCPREAVFYYTEPSFEDGRRVQDPYIFDDDLEVFFGLFWIFPDGAGCFLGCCVQA